MMARFRAPTIVVVGAASRDVDLADARGWGLGGTVSYAAITAANLGAHVRALVAVDAETAGARELHEIRAAGVELMLVDVGRAPVFENRQTPAGRVQYAIQASDRLPVESLPDDWRSPDAAILGPVAGELGDEWASAFSGRSFVGLAAQGLVRRLVSRAPVERLRLERTPLVERAGAILVSAEDIAGEAADVDALLRPGQALIVTHGQLGALFLRLGTDGVRGHYLPATPRRDPIDTTGAGDVFLAAWVTADRLLGSADHWRSLLVASAMASLSVRRASLAALPTKHDLCEVLVRLRDRRLR